MKNFVNYLKGVFIHEAGKKKEVKVEQTSTEESITLLDKALNGDEEAVVDLSKIIKSNGPTIYAFVTDKVKDAIKIGYTDQTPEKRINQWREKYGKKEGEVIPLGHWSSEEINEVGDHVFFWDHAVHEKVNKKGFTNIKKEDFNNFLSEQGAKIIDLHYSSEFFRKYKKVINNETNEEELEELSTELLIDILEEMKKAIREGKADFKLYKFTEDGKTSTKKADIVWKEPDSYSNTDLQKEAIENGVKALKEGKTNLLLAAVMRFGKTHASYEIVKESGVKKVIVTSAKADVRKAWRDDINHTDFINDFVFVEYENGNYKISYKHDGEDKIKTVSDVSIDKEINKIDELYKAGKTVILFATLHDLGGSIKNFKDKHTDLLNTEFDLMIVDETHYGSHSNLFGKATKLNKDELLDLKAEENEHDENTRLLKKLDIKKKATLQVSGTPYYILASNEMIDKDAAVISKVSYTDMIEARDKWEKDNPSKDPSKSPYFGVPTLHKIGLKLNADCRKIMAKSDSTDSMNVLFETKGLQFKHKKEITSLMKSIFGDDKSDSFGFLENKQIEGSKACRHTMMILPRINACLAMRELLKKLIDTNKREIIVVSGNENGKPDVNSIDELNTKLNELNKSGKKSLVITCVKYLTGVSMPMLDSMLYLKNAKSPQEYDQAIFRLCTRNVKDVENPDDKSPKKVNMKHNVYLIDFNISNMLTMMANSARMKAAVDGKDTKDITKKIENYLKKDIDAVPIYSEEVNGELLGKMHELNSRDLLKVFAHFNSNKSIEAITNDEIDLFNGLFLDKNFQDAINKTNVSRDTSKNTGPDQEDEGDSILNIYAYHHEISDIDDEVIDNSVKGHIDKATEKKLKEDAKKAKEKFKTITKNILYCNLCLDNPFADVDSFIEEAKKNDELKNMLSDFGIKVSDLESIYKAMKYEYKLRFNTVLLKINLLAHDTKSDEYNKVITGLANLGKIDKAEVVTPPELVKKMIKKLDKKDFDNAKSILLVNEKSGEFLRGIYEEYGKSVAEKCRIVCSSKLTKHLVTKVVKSLKLNNYIILNIEDKNNDGKLYDDFLNMNNKDILKDK